MEANWRRFRFLRKPKRALKRAGHIGINLVFAFALVVLSYAPFVNYSIPGPVGARLAPLAAHLAPGVASADPVEWQTINGAIDINGNDILLQPGVGSLVHISACPGGTVFVVADDLVNAGFDVYRSTDQGGSWELTAKSAGAGNPLRIRCSPQFTKDASVFVLSDNLVVYLSRDSGETFPIDTVSSPLGTAGDTANDLAVAGDCDTTDDCTVAVSVTVNGAGEPLVWLVVFDDDTGDFDIPDGINIQGNIEVAGNAGIAVALSPNYDDDDGLALLVNITRGGVAEVHALTTAANLDFQPPSAATLVTAGTADAGEVCLPSDYDGDDVVPNEFFVGVSLAGAAIGDAYKKDSTRWELTGVDEGVSRDIVSLSCKGPYDDAILIAGQGLTSSTTDAQVTQSSVGAESWEDDIDLWGKGPVFVSLAPDSKDAYLITGRGTAGMVAVSTNNGVDWSEVGLTARDFTKANGGRLGITHFMVGSLTNMAFISGRNWVGPVSNNGNTNSPAPIFTTTNAGETATAWYVGNRKTTANSDLGQPRVVSYSPTNPRIIWLVDDGSFTGLEADTVDQVMRSSNGGRTFANTATDPAPGERITTLQLAGDTEALVAETDAIVWRTTDNGATWTKHQDLGIEVHMFAFSPDYKADGHVLAAVTSNQSRLEVMLSKDRGVTWTQAGSSTESDAWETGGDFMHVAFDSKYSGVEPTPAGKNRIVYAAPNGGTGDDLYRYDFAMSKPVWVEMDRPNDGAGSGATRGLAVTPDGALYTVNARGEIASTFCPQIITEDIDENRCEWRRAFAPVPGTFNGVINGVTINRALYVIPDKGTNFVFLADNVGGNIFSFEDTPGMISGPTLQAPPNGGTVVQNSGENGQSFTLRWGDVAKAERYHLQVSNNADFIGPTIDRTGAGVGLRSESFTVPPNSVVNGEQYWWRVRVEQVDEDSNGDGVLDAHDGAWSKPWTFTVGQATGLPGELIGRPELVLPADGVTTPNLGPIPLTWNNPSGVSAYQIQVRPTADDGPGIDLIISDTAQVQAASYTIQPPKFGVGNYVMLPGATYYWLVRTSAVSPAPASSTAPGWGPWSTPRSFKTPRPNPGTIQLVSPINGSVVTTKKPVLSWKDANDQMFYYEVQLSSDPDFGAGPRGPIAAVQHQLVHAGVANPPSTYTSPMDLAAGTYYWRVRQRVQATPLGPEEPGIAWTATQNFKVQ